MELNVQDWQEFTLNRVFRLVGGFYNKKPEHSGIGTIPFLASTESNNGVTEYYSIDDIRAWDKVGEPDNTLDKKIFDGNCIAVTVNGSVCNAFYQNKEFTCSHDITALYLKKHVMNVYEAQFFCAIIMQDKYRWNYGRKPHDVKKFGKSIFKFPIQHNEDGSPVIDENKTYSDEGYIPDWQFMEDYIKSLRCKSITTKKSPQLQLELQLDKWEWFLLGSLFEIKKGKRLTSADQEEGENNYVGAIDSNNGIANHIGQQPIHSGNTISLSYNGSVGEAFYQAEPYWATDDVNALYSKYEGFNKLIGLFIATVIRQEKYKFSYGRKWTLDNMKISEIKLPIQRDDDDKPIIDAKKKYSENGYIPDWKFMEDYINSLPYSDRI